MSSLLIFQVTAWGSWEPDHVMKGTSSLGKYRAFPLPKKSSLMLFFLSFFFFKSGLRTIRGLNSRLRYQELREPARCPSLLLSYPTNLQLFAANDPLFTTVLPFLEFHKNGILHTVMYPSVSGLFNLVSSFWSSFLVLDISVIRRFHCGQDHLVWLHRSLFIHSLEGGQLVCLQFVAIVTKAAMKICMQVFLWTHIVIHSE